MFWLESQDAGIETQAAHQKNWLFVLVDPNGRNNDDLERKLSWPEESSST